MIRRSMMQVILLAVSALALLGQSFNGTIAGVVTDGSAAMIPNAVVTVVNEGTGVQRRLVADASGVWVAAELPVGYYHIRLEFPGLISVERKGVKVDVGGETRLDATLTVESTKETVDVTAAEPQEPPTVLANRSQRFSNSGV